MRPTSGAPGGLASSSIRGDRTSTRKQAGDGTSIEGSTFTCTTRHPAQGCPSGLGHTGRSGECAGRLRETLSDEEYCARFAQETRGLEAILVPCAGNFVGK